MDIFCDPVVLRECNQWKSIYCSPSACDGHSQLFTNFGSISEEKKSDKGYDDIISIIAEKFAMDIYQELKNDLSTNQVRIQTSQAGRNKSRTKPYTTAKGSVITPHHSRRGCRSVFAINSIK